jgi:methionyl-tRNA formyltransferase
VTIAPSLDRSERRLDWARPARDVHNAIRGLQPWPQAAGLLRGRRVIFRRSSFVAPAANQPAGAPGTVVGATESALLVAAAPGTGLVALREIQAEGRAASPAPAFAAGYHVQAGDRFEPLPPDA